MLKLQQRGTEKTIWLVGPLVKIGSARTSDFIVTGTSIEPHHCSLHVSEESIVVEPMGDAVAYLNEKQIKGKQTVDVGDVLRIVNHEFLVIDPANKTAATAPVAENFKAAPVSSEATVFRAGPAPGNADAANQASGWLIQGLHKSLQNKRYPIEGAMVLGRTADCELAFSYDRLSRRHAELKIIDGVLVVRDLDSSNGTFVNGEKVKQATLHHGDTLAFDKLEFAVIGPNTAKAATADKDLSHTVVRPAIKVDALQQGKAADKQAKDKAVKASEAASTTSIIIMAVAVIILALLAFVFLI